MTLTEHLAELRRRLIICLLAVAVGGVIAFIFYPQILEWLTGPYRDVCEAKNLTCPGKLVITDPLEGFAVRMKVTGYGGLVLALPVVLWQIWRFITPGLYENEKRYAIPFVFASVALFIMGALIALWTFPKALQFLISFSGDVQPLFAPGAYFSLIMLMMLAFGIGFEFPVLLVFARDRRRAHPATALGRPALRGRRDRRGRRRHHAERRPVQPRSLCRSRCSSSTRWRS